MAESPFSLRSWGTIFGTKNGEPLSWSETCGTYRTLWECLLYVPLLVPETRVIRDRVFLYRGEDEAAFAAEREAIFERVAPAEKHELDEAISNYNWIELDGQFGRHGREHLVSDADVDQVLMLVQNMIKECWQVTLAGRHPDRKFMVRVFGVDDPECANGVEFREV